MPHLTKTTRDTPRLTEAENAEPSDNARYPSLYQINTRVWLSEQPLSQNAATDRLPEP